MFYTLFITVAISGQWQELRLKTFDRFEECWEVATILIHNRPNMTARCQAVETGAHK